METPFSRWKHAIAKGNSLFTGRDTLVHDEIILPPGGIILAQDGNTLLQNGNSLFTGRDTLVPDEIILLQDGIVLAQDGNTFFKMDISYCKMETRYCKLEMA